MAGANKFPGEDNTGHLWDDDVRELNNRPPRWYMIALYLGAIAIVIYSIYFPSIPWYGDHTKGYAGWTAITELEESNKELNEYRERKYSKLEKGIEEKSVSEILQDDELKIYSIKTAKTLFGDNCAACHGSSGQGNEGFPVLVDDNWLYGGKIQDIEKSILKGRKGNMPARMMGITDIEASAFATYLIEISKGEDGAPDNKSKAIYMAKGCIGCHGPTMEGNKFMGSANLADGIFRFKAEDQHSSLVKTILYGVNQNNKNTQNAEMPAFEHSEMIDREQIKKLAIFVHQLGGGVDEVVVKKTPKKLKIIKKVISPSPVKEVTGRPVADLYTKCQGCHDSGVMGAPKFQNDDDWSERSEDGIAGLLDNAINGIGGMPPKGTCFDCTDDELQSIIEYMYPAIATSVETPVVVMAEPVKEEIIIIAIDAPVAVVEPVKEETPVIIKAEIEEILIEVDKEQAAKVTLPKDANIDLSGVMVKDKAGNLVPLESPSIDIDSVLSTKIYVDFWLNEKVKLDLIDNADIYEVMTTTTYKDIEVNNEFVKGWIIKKSLIEVKPATIQKTQPVILPSKSAIKEVIKMLKEVTPKVIKIDKKEILVEVDTESLENRTDIDSVLSTKIYVDFWLNEKVKLDIIDNADIYEVMTTTAYKDIEVNNEFVKAWLNDKNQRSDQVIVEIQVIKTDSAKAKQQPLEVIPTKESNQIKDKEVTESVDVIVADVIKIESNIIDAFSSTKKFMKFWLEEKVRMGIIETSEIFKVKVTTFYGLRLEVGEYMNLWIQKEKN
jgi:cytochrome c oxidase cbb3-type subunit 3